MGMTTGVISNSFAEVPRIVLRQTNLMGLLDIVVLSRDICRRKPHPEIFLYATKKVGVSPGESLFIGDIPEVDIYGAKSIGMTAVLIPSQEAWSDWRNLLKKYTPTPDGPTQPDYKIYNLKEILEILVSY